MSSSPLPSSPASLESESLSMINFPVFSSVLKWVASCPGLRRRLDFAPDGF
jgi:hypothetical protein